MPVPKLYFFPSTFLKKDINGTAKHVDASGLARLEVILDFGSISKHCLVKSAFG